MEFQGIVNNQNDLEKEQSWKSHPPDFKTYYKAIVIIILVLKSRHT